MSFLVRPRKCDAHEHEYFHNVKESANSSKLGAQYLMEYICRWKLNVIQDACTNVVEQISMCN